MATDKLPDVIKSDTVKPSGNPFAKKAHSYDVPYLMHATEVKRFPDGIGDLVWEFSDKGESKVHPRIHQKHDYNMVLKLPDEIHNISVAARVPCALEIFWVWKKPTGRQTQDTIKVIDIVMREDAKPTKQVARMKAERAEKHPELFDTQGEPYKAPPIRQTIPASPEKLAERELQGRIASYELYRKNRVERDYWPEWDTNDYPRDMQVWEGELSFASLEDMQQSQSDAAQYEAENEADKVFGKKPAKRPVINPDNWTHDGPKLRKFYADLNDKGWNKYGIPGPEKSKHIHTALGVNSLHETTLSADVALVKILVYLDKLFGTKESPVTDQTTTEITQDQWNDWLAVHNWVKKPFVLKALDEYSIEHGEGPVTKLSQWSWDLDIAEIVVDDFLAVQMEKNAQQADQSAETQSTQPTTPATQEQASQSPKPSATNGSKPAFRKATKQDSKLRLAIGGVPGGGKTWTALQIATEMFPNGKIAVLDTESGSAEKYADKFNFDVLTIEEDFRPEKFIDAIHAAEDGGYDVLIIDSFSHEWAAPGGILDIVDKWKETHPTKEGKEDGRAAWGHASPRHNDLVTAILQSKIHIIATMRCKWKTVAARDEQTRKPISVKVIGDLEQRGKIEFEFDIVALCDQYHNIIIDKTRCSELDGYKGNKSGKEVAQRIGKWLGIAAA